MLTTDVDFGSQVERADKRRKSGKQSVAKKEKAKKKPRAMKDDDDDDDDDKDDDHHQGEGEDLEAKESDVGQGDKENQEDVEEQGDVEEKKKPKGKGKAKAKAKAKGAAAPDKGPIRDRSKSKKFFEILDQLPSAISGHFRGLSRSDQTDFIHAGVERKNGHLAINHGAMWQMQIKRSEQQKGAEKMCGYIREDL